jgi:nicotinamide mononucleotide transporter
MRIQRDAAVLFLLTVVTAGVAGWMVHAQRASWLEAFSVVTGALCVWLTVKESVWNFPISLANVVAFGFVFARARLFADSGLQAVYFVLTLQGWYLWIYGGAGRTVLHISRGPRRELLLVALAGAAMTAALDIYLRHVGGAMPFWDGLTTALSLCAQWLLNRKYLQSWYAWIAVDVLYIPIYAYKDLYLTSSLYVVFLVMATMGWLEWRRRWLVQSRGASADAQSIQDVAAAAGAVAEVAA